jgi:DNA-binding CsgD family transcriptional regulator
MINHKLRLQSLLNTVSEVASKDGTSNALESAFFYSVGTWSLIHQQWIENFCQSQNLHLVAVPNCSEMLELTKDMAHLPYHLGLILCQTDNDMNDALRLVKFFNTSHPDRVVQHIFMGVGTDLDSALYLAERSSGFKNISNLDAESFFYFLEQTIKKSLKKRSQLVESLVNIARLSSLTAKELSVMIQVISGLANKEIAEKMNNSSRTIELHRASVFEKMDVKNAIDLSMSLHSIIKN